MFSSVVGWVWGVEEAGERKTQTQRQPESQTQQPERQVEQQPARGEDATTSIGSGWEVIIAGEEGAHPSTLELTHLDTNNHYLPDVADDAHTAAALALLEAEPVFSKSPSPEYPPTDATDPTSVLAATTAPSWIPLHYMADSLSSDLSHTDAEMLRVELAVLGRRDFVVQKPQRSPASKAKAKVALQKRMDRADWEEKRARGRGTAKSGGNSARGSGDHAKHTRRKQAQEQHRVAKHPAWKKERRQADKVRC